MEETIQLHDKKFKKFLDRNEIQKVVSEIAERINHDYSDRTPTFLIVLKGAILFAADLLRNIKIRCRIEVISAKSYGSEMESSGTVKLKSIEDNFHGKDIIIIEDIIDSGLTLKTLTEKIQTYQPNSVECSAILSKPSARKVNVEVKYTGIEIPELFVVGYGLDYAELGRELADIYILSE